MLCTAAHLFRIGGNDEAMMSGITKQNRLRYSC